MCSKCGCSGFCWNPVSAVAKVFDKFKPSTVELEAGTTWKIADINGKVTWVTSDDAPSANAYRNCTCGHHWNYH